MKQLMLLFGFCIILSATQAQTNYTYYKSKLVSEGYTICEDWSGQLRQGESGVKNRKYMAGLTYKIYVFTEDADVKDIDLYLLHGDGSVFKSDPDNLNWCMLTFSTLYDRYLDLKIVNYLSYTPNYESSIRILIGVKL